jgi:phosphate transport system substrate-binding protein
MIRSATAAWVLCAGLVALAQAQESTEGLAMQEARAKMMTVRGKKLSYTKKFDLSGLPRYQPQQKLSGTLRIRGSNYISDGFLGGHWEAAFKKYHPGVKIDYLMKTTLAAVPALTFGDGDIGIGRKITFAEQELFERYKDRAPVEIELATGSYDVPGWQPGYGIVVHKDNPLTQLAIKQLDGIFGAERLGGWEGTSWRPERARGPEENIRTWGQLGLGGEWKDKPINVYGLNLRYHQATEISDLVLGGSDKWNERLRIYANHVSAAGTLERSLNDHLARDRYGISYIAAPTTKLGGQAAPDLKVLAIAAKEGGPYVPYSLDTLHDRSYPLYSRIYAYADRAPGKPMDPRVLEFLRFVVSQEGQAEVMRDGKYLPLTAGVAKAQMRKLDELAASAAGERASGLRPRASGLEPRAAPR